MGLKSRMLFVQFSRFHHFAKYYCTFCVTLVPSVGVGDIPPAPLDVLPVIFRSVHDVACLYGIYPRITLTISSVNATEITPWIRCGEFL